MTGSVGQGLTLVAAVTLLLLVVRRPLFRRRATALGVLLTAGALARAVLTTALADGSS